MIIRGEDKSAEVSRNVLTQRVARNTSTGRKRLIGLTDPHLKVDL